MTLKNSKHNLKYNFIFSKNADQPKKAGIFHLCLNKQRSVIEHQRNDNLIQRMTLSLSVDSKTNLSL